MPSPLLQSTPTKPTHPRGGVPPLPAKFSPGSPSQSRYLPQSPVRFGPGTLHEDAKKIAERRRARQSVTPTKPVARFDSICQDSKTILNDMAGMFSPKKGEPETPEVSPFRIEVEAPPAASPVEEPSRKDRRDDQGGRGQARRKKVINPEQIRRRARSPADPISGGGTSKRRRQ